MKKNNIFLMTCSTVFAILGLLVVSTTATNLNNHAIAQSQNQSDSEQNFSANLTSSGVIPPLNPSTNATGNATFSLQEGANAMSYKLSGSNLGNVTQVALISSTGGPVENLVVFHYAPAEGLLTEGSGTLEGNITSESFIGELSGKPVSDLVTMISDGIIHIRVGTVDHPLGEIGGKVQPVL